MYLTKKQQAQRAAAYASAIIRHMQQHTKSRSSNGGHLAAKYSGDAEYDYTMKLRNRALCEMEQEYIAQQRWQQDKAWRGRVLAIPVYARAVIFGDALPPKHKELALRHAGSALYIGAHKSRYTHYTYHAVYRAVQNKAGTEAYIILADGAYGRVVMRRRSWHCRALGLTHIASQRPRGTPALQPAQQVRVLRRLIAQAGRSGDWVAEYDECGLCIIENATGEVFHHPELPRIIEFSEGAFLHRARARAQKARNTRLDALLTACGQWIYVSVADSLASGNCEVGTGRFVRELSNSLQAEGELGAATAAAILALRSDNYTRRACRVAAARKFHFSQPE